MFPLLLSLSGLAAGCTGEGGGTSPAEQYERIIAHARAGQLSAASNALLPPSYATQLDEVLRQLGQLVDRQEYESLRDVLSGAGGRLAGLLSLGGAEDPALKLVTAKLREIPEVLGIDTYERFQKLDTARVVKALEDGLFREFIGLDGIRGKFAGITVELKERKRDWARLRFRFAPEGGDVLEQEIDLIRVEDRWVPDDWVTDWPALMAEWQGAIQSAMETKLKTPEAFKEHLGAIQRAMKDPMSLLEYLPQLRQRLGLGWGEKGPKK